MTLKLTASIICDLFAELDFSEKYVLSSHCLELCAHSHTFFGNRFFICHPQQISGNISYWDRHYLLARELLPRFKKNPSQKLDLVMSVGALKGLSELFFVDPSQIASAEILEIHDILYFPGSRAS